MQGPFRSLPKFKIGLGVLSLYSYGQVTGTIVEIGDGVTHTIPIFDGFCMPHAVNRVDNAGRDLTTYLQKLLMEEGVNLSSSAEFQIVRDLKGIFLFFCCRLLFCFFRKILFRREQSRSVRKQTAKTCSSRWNCKSKNKKNQKIQHL